MNLFLFMESDASFENSQRPGGAFENCHATRKPESKRRTGIEKRLDELIIRSIDRDNPWDRDRDGDFDRDRSVASVIFDNIHCLAATPDRKTGDGDEHTKFAASSVLPVPP